MAKTREIASAAGIPLGGSASSDAGEVINPAFTDHVHSFWEKWREVPLLGKWAGAIYYSMCGNAVWIRGSASVDLQTATYFTENVARLPKIARPTYTVLHPDRTGNADTVVVIGPDGYLKVHNSYDVSNLGVNYNLFNIAVDDMIYRTIR